MEIVGSLVSQLSKDAPPKEWKEMESWEYYADNGASVSPQSAQGSPFSAAAVAVTGDPLTNLYEDLAADGAILQGINTLKWLTYEVFWVIFYEQAFSCSSEKNGISSEIPENLNLLCVCFFISLTY